MAGAAGSRQWLWRVLLALVQAVLYFVALRNVKYPNRRWCMSDHLYLDCQNEHGRAVANNRTTGLKVVLPSVGQTGTTAVTSALRTIGLRAYHADDFSAMARALMYDRIPAGFLATQISRCRFEAISLEPIVDILPHILTTSPGAKFIMTWRSFESVRKSNAQFQKRQRTWPPLARALVKSNRILPWVETFDAFTGLLQAARLEGAPFHYGTNKYSAYLYKVVCPGYNLPRQRLEDRGIWKIKASEEAYLAHQNEIRTQVPTDRLLEFDVKRHGWAELEGFLGIESERSASGKRLPRKRSSTSMRTNDPLLELSPEIGVPVFMTVASLHGLNLCVLALALHLLLLPVFLLWPVARTGGRKRLRGVLARSPLVPTIDGLWASENLVAGKALAEAGVRMIAVSLSSPEPLKSIRLLSQALPQNVLVGASDVAMAGAARLVKREGGTFIVNTHVDEKLIREAKAQGILCVAGASTASEAAAARKFGADGVVACPGESVLPERIRAIRRALPPHFCLLVSPPALPKREALAELKAAGIHAFGTTFGTDKTAEAPAKVAARARELLTLCSAS